MRRASIVRFRKSGKVFLSSISTLTEGGGVNTEPYIRLIEPVSVDEFYRSLMVVLENSKMGLPRPKNLNDPLKKYLDAIDLVEHKELYDDSICVSVVERDGVITFFPSKNNGIKGGFSLLANLKIDIPTGNPSDVVVQSLRSTLDKCE